MLPGTFVGDALGMAWERMPGDDVPEVLEMCDARLGRGTYTDDTQMMIALAESLLRSDVVDDDDLAGAFLAQVDPRRGYGRGTLRVLDSLRRRTPVGQAASEVFEGRGSLGNGAAMRVAPVAVWRSPSAGWTRWRTASAVAATPSGLPRSWPSARSRPTAARPPWDRGDRRPATASRRWRAARTLR